MPRMMAALTAPTTPDLLAALTPPRAGIAAPLPVELDAVTLEALVSAIDDRLEVAPADEALELHRGRRALILELSRVLDA